MLKRCYLIYKINLYGGKMKILLTIVVISLLTISCSRSASNMIKNKFLSQYSLYAIEEGRFVRNSSVDNSAEYQLLIL